MNGIDLKALSPEEFAAIEAQIQEERDRRAADRTEELFRRLGDATNEELSLLVDRIDRHLNPFAKADAKIKAAIGRHSRRN